MSLCRACMADITWAIKEGTEDERVPLDLHEPAMQGEGRFQIIDGNPPTAKPIDPNYPGEGYVDHRTICQQPRAI